MTIAILTLLTTVAISMLITRLAAMALILTGMSEETAKFQARSALSGVGFTTREAEQVVEHPVRRRIIMLLMLFGSVSVPTVIAALAVSLLTTFQAEQWWWPALLLASGLLLLAAAAKNRWLNEKLNRVLAWGLKRWTDLEVRDYVALLQLQNGYVVTEMLVEPADWLADKTLAQLALSHKGILVLGIERPDGTYIGAPRGNHRIQPGDKLILYARTERIEELDQRTVEFGEATRQATSLAPSPQTEASEESNRGDLQCGSSEADAA